MQFQSDISNIKILKPKNIESTALGVAIMAGLQSNLWKTTEEAFSYKKADKIYKPKMKPIDRNNKLTGWKKTLKQL